MNKKYKLKINSKGLTFVKFSAFDQVCYINCSLKILIALNNV